MFSDLETLSDLEDNSTTETEVNTTLSMLNNQPLVHAFESKGLGIAPFRFDHISEGKAHCDFCGTYLKNLYHIKSSDNKCSIVGSECINKAGDSGLINIVKQHKAKKAKDARIRKIGKQADEYKLKYPEIVNWLEVNHPNDDYAASLLQALYKYGSLTDNQHYSIAKKVNTPKIDQSVIDEYILANPLVSEWLLGNKDSNSFALSLYKQLHSKGTLSEGQSNAVLRQLDSTVSLSSESFEPVMIMFNKAKESGLKKPKLYVGDLLISMAPAHSLNVGCLYVKSKGVYLGKITTDYKFIKGGECSNDNLELVTDLSNDAKGKIFEHGKHTGKCACCNLELTKKESIALGVGPICASRWGI